MQFDPEVIVATAEDLIRQRLEVKIVRTINHLAIGFVIGVVAAFILRSSR
jgi:ABC-type nitrate/sulfonate/bicarbonate transport system permease component